MLLLLLLGCPSSSGRRPETTWRPWSEPRLGVKLDVADGWRADTVDDAIILLPPVDDFAIVVVRAGTGALDENAALARIGAIREPALHDVSARNPAASLRAGRATLAATNKPVVLRIARITDGPRTTLVGAVMAPDVERRGIAAFDHVVKSLALSEPPTVATPALPAWIDKGDVGDAEGSDDE